MWNWYAHLVCSNLNWLITVTLHLFQAAYHLSGYLSRLPTTESRNMQNSFLGLIILIRLIYLWLAYFGNKQTKLNFCNEYILKKVSFFIYHILIAKGKSIRNFGMFP